ncbi:MAG: hypothetical protein PVF58_20970 [Candidatus Methanofastidiosia archaeon]|jgi:hypothetical protein
MKEIYIWIVSAALLMGLYAHVQDVAAVVDMVEDGQLPEFGDNSTYRDWEPGDPIPDDMEGE